MFARGDEVTLDAEAGQPSAVINGQRLRRASWRERVVYLSTITCREGEP